MDLRQRDNVERWRRETLDGGDAGSALNGSSRAILRRIAPPEVLIVGCFALIGWAALVAWTGKPGCTGGAQACAVEFSQPGRLS